MSLIHDSDHVLIFDNIRKKVVKLHKQFGYRKYFQARKC